MHIATRAFLFAVALLAGMEGVVRWGFNDIFVGRTDYGYHPTAGFVEKPDRIALLRAGGRRFWPQTFAKPKPVGRFRIFTVGDSVARGKSLEQSYAWLLGERLRARGHDVESLNLAVPGYGVRRRLVVLEQVLKYEPDLVILHLNHTNEFEDEREWRRAQEARKWSPDQWLRKSYIIARLDQAKTENMFWKLPAGVRSVREVNDHDAELAAVQHTEQGRVWDRFFREKTVETVRLLQARGVPVILLTKASLDATRSRLDDETQDAFANTLAGSGVGVVSTRQVFSVRPRFEQHFNRDGVHWQPQGHQVMAEALLPVIERAMQDRR